MNLRTRIAAGAMSAAMVGLGVSAPAEAASSDPLRVTGTFEGRAFSGQLGDLSLSRPAGATRATLTGTLRGAGLPGAGARFTATADVTVSAVDPVAPPPVMAPVEPPVMPPVEPLVMPPVAPSDTRPIAPPVIQVPGMCTVLQLDVENLHLDLLGLVVLIPDPGLHLVIGGAPRDGALLGNLLCQLAGGVDQRTPAQSVAPVPRRRPTQLSNR